MYKFVSLIICLVPVVVFGQEQQGFDPQKMQGMMANIQKMQKCMENIDQTKMRAFEQQGKQMAAEVKTLCASGDRTQAQSKVLAYSEQIRDSSAMQDIKRCSEIMQGMMPDISSMIQSYGSADDGSHICDNVQKLFE